jgi:hypothetical protein
LLKIGLTPETPVWRPGQRDWVPARVIPELAALLGCPPAWVVPSEQLAATTTSPILLPMPKRFNANPLRRLRETVPGLRAPLRVGAWLYAACLVLVLVGWICFATAVYLGGKSQQPRYDPQQREIVIDDRPEFMEHANAFGFTSIGCGLLALLALSAGTVALLVFLYRAWDAIQDGWTAVSPGSAVGLLFVPCFNFYWVFVGVAGLAGEVNAFVHRHRLAGRRASNTLGVIVGVVAILGSMPCIGLGPLLLAVLLFPIFLRSIQLSLIAACHEAQSVPDNRPALTPVELIVLHRPPEPRSWMKVMAAVLGVLGLELLVISAIGAHDVGRAYFRQQRQIEAAEVAVSHLRTQPALPVADQERLQGYETEIAQWQQGTEVQTSMRRVVAAEGMGIVFVVLALALALASSRGRGKSALHLNQ